MTFKNISLAGSKRTFIVDSVNGTPLGHGTFDRKVTSVKISSSVLQPDQPLTNGVLPRLKLVDIAGIDLALEKLNDFLRDFQRKSPIVQQRRSCGVLLHGSHGTGKTLIIDKIIGTGWGKVHRIKRDTKSAAIRSIFKEARQSQPSIIAIDNLEFLVSREDSVSETTAEVLEEELDGLVAGSPSILPRVLVVAATLNANRIPVSLRKAGRFREDILLPVPDAAARKQILKSLAPPLKPDGSQDILEKLGERTHAYTAEDLHNLLDEAYKVAIKKCRDNQKSEDDDPETLEVGQDDIEQALLLVRPTAMHDITLQPPSVKWDEIGGQENVKEALRDAVETPLKVSHLSRTVIFILTMFSIPKEWLAWEVLLLKASFSTAPLDAPKLSAPKPWPPKSALTSSLSKVPSFSTCMSENPNDKYEKSLPVPKPQVQVSFSLMRSTLSVESVHLVAETTALMFSRLYSMKWMVLSL